MTTPLTARTLVAGLARASDPQISPDGSRFVYALGRVDADTGRDAEHLWMRRLDGGDPVQLTRSGEHNTAARWSPDGHVLAFVSSRAGSRTDGSGLYLVPASGPGEPREIARHAHDLAAPAWSPDGTRIAYTARFDPDDPDDAILPDGTPPRVRVTRRLDHKRDGLGYLGSARSQVFVVDVADGAARRVTVEAEQHARPAWSPDGRQLAVGVDHWATDTSPVLVIDAESGALVSTIALESGGFSAWAWSPAGDRIVLAGEPLPSTGQPDWYLYEAVGGRLARLTEDLACRPHDGVDPVWLDDDTVLFGADRAGMSGLYRLDVRRGDVTEVRRVPATRDGLSVDAARRFVVQAHQSFTETGEIAVTDLASATDRVVTRHNTDLLAAAPPARAERLVLDRAGLEIEGWVLVPPDAAPGRRYPLVLDVHGGPQAHFGNGFTPTHQLLATNGFVVLAVNPRGSTSYGRDFGARVNGDWGGEDYLDLMAAVDLAAQRPDVDPARLGVTGYSYGGYMTAWILGQTDRFGACVSGAPCFSLESEYGTGDMDFIAGEWEWGGPPHLAREHYLERSPATWAHRATTPTLIIQGEADDRCPIGQAEQMFVALSQAGCEVELARYPGASHSLRWAGHPAHRIDVLERTLAWLKDHLGA